jgi:hypothetical protein
VPPARREFRRMVVGRPWCTQGSWDSCSCRRALHDREPPRVISVELISPPGAPRRRAKPAPAPRPSRPRRSRPPPPPPPPPKPKQIVLPEKPTAPKPPDKAKPKPREKEGLQGAAQEAGEGPRRAARRDARLRHDQARGRARARPRGARRHGRPRRPAVRPRAPRDLARGGGLARARASGDEGDLDRAAGFRAQRSRRTSSSRSTRGNIVGEPRSRRSPGIRGTTRA